MAAPLLSTGFINSILFSGYSNTLRFLHRNNINSFNPENRDNFTLSEIVFASSVGSTIQLIPGIPIELVKTKLQVIIFVLIFIISFYLLFLLS